MASLPRAITDLVNNLERLPGVGPKSATRLAFYLLSAGEGFNTVLAENIKRVKSEIKICQKCFSVAEADICDICSDNKRNQNQIWVVERAIDVVALENVGGGRGVYHVLGGAINPLDHVGPDEIKIAELVERVNLLEGEIEIILAVNPTMEGEATTLYIKKQLEGLGKNNLKITRIGSGLPMGADLEFADQATLLRSMEGRRAI